MIYTQTKSLILLADYRLSESIVYSVLLEFEGITNSREERLIALLERTQHAMTRVTVNSAINALVKKKVIQKDLSVIRLPDSDPIIPIMRTKAGRPYKDPPVCS